MENMVMKSSSDSKPQNNEAPSEKLGDSSTVWEDPVESKEEEEGKRGVCLLMEGGDCRDSFTAWEVCVEKTKDEDLVTKCMEVTNTLYKCVVAHTEPFLTAEKVVREEQVKNEEISEEARKLA